MKAVASILCLYLFGLFLQPALFPLKDKEKKELSCCSKSKSHKGCSKNDGCCDNDQCNPFFSQCPLCAANATTVKQYLVPQPKPEFYSDPEFYTASSQLITQCPADILRPPQHV